MSAIVKRRDFYCRIKLENCTRITVDPAHVFGRSNLATRWDINAIFGSCRNCHNYIDTHPEEKKQIFIEIMSEEEYDRLERISKQTYKLLPPQLKALRDMLNATHKLGFMI